MAVKLIFKRSSVLGKRPSSSVIEPGELALNTNSNEPGIFFEVTDGNVIKVGPTSVLPTYPTSTPELGEMWYNTIKGTLNTGTVENAQKAWAAIAAPYLGGSGYTVAGRISPATHHFCSKKSVHFKQLFYNNQ